MDTFGPCQRSLIFCGENNRKLSLDDPWPLQFISSWASFSQVLNDLFLHSLPLVTFWFPSSAWLLISNFPLRQDRNCRLPEARSFLAQCGLHYSSILPILQPAGDHLLYLPKGGLVASVHHCLVTWLLLHLISFKYCSISEIKQTSWEQWGTGQNYNKRVNNSSQ